MSLKERLIKNALFFSIVAYYLGGYFLINLYTSTRSTFHHLQLPFEAQIPFHPIFIFGYMSLFLIIGSTYVLIQDLDFFKKTVKAFYIIVTIHFICFLVFPVEYTLRPDINPQESWMHLVVHFYYWVDLPYNCFPSLHISNAFMCELILRRYHKPYGKLFMPLAVLVCISTIIVKQHYIVDLLAGLPVAYLVYRWVWREQKVEVLETQVLAETQY